VPNVLTTDTVLGLAINWIDEGKLSFCPVEIKEIA